MTPDGVNIDEPPVNRTAMRLRDLLRLDRDGGGQLHAVRTRGTTRRRATAPLIYVDTTDGRWVTQLVPADGGERHVVAFPAHPGKVHDKLTELLAHVEA